MTIESTRRGFLKGAAAAAAGLTIGFRPDGVLAASPASNPEMLTPFVRIDPDGTVTAIIKHFEMGQGTSTGLATLIAEELGLGLDQVKYAFAPSNPAVYNNLFFGPFQGTGGSTAMANSFLQYRQAGAAAREMLLQAAADHWNMESSELAIGDGMVTGGGKAAPLADFVAAAASLEVPADPPLKDPGEFVLIGNPDTARLDNLPKVTGQAVFAMDKHVPDQMFAVILRSPKFGGLLNGFDASDAESMPGFVHAAALPNKAGVAVFADSTWTAIQARDAITADWDFSMAETRSSDQMTAELSGMVNSEPEFVVRGEPGLEAVEAALDSASSSTEAEYSLPYLCHAMMEPLNCVIEPAADGGVTVHDGCQSPTATHNVMMQVLGLPFEKIRINTLFAGGSFGRRSTAAADYAVEAALAYAVSGGKRPVKLVWTREDDIKGGYYRPAVAHRVRVGVGADGNIASWDHRVAGQSIFKGTFFEQAVVRNGIDFTSVEGIPDTPYAIPVQFVGLTDFKTPVTVTWLRSVGHTHTAFVMETMMDMAAGEAGIDPVEFRLLHLPGDTPDQVRIRTVLELAAEKSGWGRDVPEGHFQGVAVHKSFGSFVAEVAEVSVRDGAVKIEKMTCAVDCGLAVNPDIIKAQVESAVGYGLGLAMRNEITLTDGEVDQWNFPDYEPLRIGDIGMIETHIVPSDEAPSGIGEPGTPPAAPAVANAVHAATGIRMTSLPFSKHVDFA